jgi:hypothetical protein
MVWEFERLYGLKVLIKIIRSTSRVFIDFIIVKST